MAYEMRISDWSSDGCSADLAVEATAEPALVVDLPHDGTARHRRVDLGELADRAGAVEVAVVLRGDVEHPLVVDDHRRVVVAAREEAEDALGRAALVEGAEVVAEDQAGGGAEVDDVLVDRDGALHRCNVVAVETGKASGRGRGGQEG